MPCHFKGVLSHHWYGETIGQSGSELCRYGFSRLQCGSVRSAKLWLHSNDFDIGLQCLDGAGNSSNETGSAHGNDDKIHTGHVINDLHSNRPGSRENGWIVVSIDVVQTIAGYQSFGMLFGLSNMLSVDDDARSKSLYNLRVREECVP